MIKIIPLMNGHNFKCNLDVSKHINFYNDWPPQWKAQRYLGINIKQNYIKSILLSKGYQDAIPTQPTKLSKPLLKCLHLHVWTTYYILFSKST